MKLIKFIQINLLGILPMLLTSTMLFIGDTTLPTLSKITCATFLLLYIFIIIYIYKYYNKVSGMSLHFINFKNLVNIILSLILIRLIFFIGTYLMTILENKKTTLNDQLLISNNFHDLPLLTFLLFLVTITFISPIIEELIYRGILRFLFFKADKLFLPLIISSTIFSVFHLTTDFISFIMYFLAGSLLFYNYYKSNNLTQSILLHISNNLFFAIELIQNYFN
ncbi:MULTISPECIES: CPBP family intramembrane glutamic endopeptidase [Staphylococcus]|nr:hypothetical protein BUZ33_10725 [Staphylococcus haemolyticus]